MRILVVEDELNLKTAIGRVVRRVDPEVQIDWVTTAEEAEMKLHQYGYDLMILDYTLAGMGNGMDLWWKVRGKLPWLPVVMISGLSVSEFFDMVPDPREAPPFLSKPFSNRELLTMIQSFGLKMKREAA